MYGLGLLGEIKVIKELLEKQRKKNHFCCTVLLLFTIASRKACKTFADITSFHFEKNMKNEKNFSHSFQS